MSVVDRESKHSSRRGNESLPESESTFAPDGSATARTGGEKAPSDWMKGGTEPLVEPRPGYADAHLAHGRASSFIAANPGYSVRTDESRRGTLAATIFPVSVNGGVRPSACVWGVCFMRGEGCRDDLECSQVVRAMPMEVVRAAMDRPVPGPGCTQIKHRGCSLCPRSTSTPTCCLRRCRWSSSGTARTRIGSWCLDQPS